MKTNTIGMKIQEITSAQNPKIKETVALMEKSKERRAQKLFVVEGIREVAACIRNGYTIKSIFFNSQIVTPQQIENLFPDNPSLDLNSTQLFSLSPAAYSKIAYRENTEGIVAVVEEKRLQLQEVKFGRQWKQPLVLVVESVEKPGNLGALLRTADACGIDAVLVCDPLTDLYNPNLIRSSLGGIFTNQVVACSNEEALEWLRHNNINIFTAQLQDSEWYYDTNMAAPTAIVMGTESTGLTNFWREASNAKIKIPMLGELDSLNVSVSAAVLCYEAVRQRNL
jgi:TrmH family RNA methyltransferase